MELKQGKSNSNLILSMENLPTRAMTYLRHYRDVEIYNKMLEFIIPLYEQSRFEEQKDIPLIQIIDKAVPPQKKAFPQRTLLSIVATIIILIIIALFIIAKEYFSLSDDPKIRQLISSFSNTKKS